MPLTVTFPVKSIGTAFRGRVVAQPWIDRALIKKMIIKKPDVRLVLMALIDSSFPGNTMLFGLNKGV
jgi:hypothetical protein